MSPRPSAAAREMIFAGQTPQGLEAFMSNPAKYGAVTSTRLPMFRERVKKLQTMFSLPANATVLDVGASSGEFLVAVSELGWKAVGVEPSADGVKSGLEKGLDVVQSSAERLPFDDGTFDLVHSNHVFEHLADPQQAAREAYRVLKTDGVIFIEVPNQFDNIQFFRDRKLDRVTVRARNARSIHHLYFFSKKTLKRLLEVAGFSEVHVYDRFGRPRGGVGRVGSIAMRTIGAMYLGGPIIQGIGRKR